jgi:integrase
VAPFVRRISTFSTASTDYDTLRQPSTVFDTLGLAVSTTCRGVEIKNLRWQDLDLFARVATIRRSKTAAGHRTIPLNGDVMAALARLLEHARALGSSESEHYGFPACEERIIDPSRPQKSWRTAWRKLVSETGARFRGKASEQPSQPGNAPLAPIRSLRFHDLRHQVITEMAKPAHPTPR